MSQNTKIQALQALSLIFVIMIVVSGCGVQGKSISTLEKIDRTGKIDICYIEWPPTIIKDSETGALSGHLIDMANFLAKSMDVEPNYLESGWDKFPADLNSGNCDLVVAGVFATIPRAKSVAFSRPMSYVGNSALIAKNSELINTANIDDLDKKGITIAVLNGEQGHEYVKQNFKNAEIKVLQGSDLTLPLLDVVAGRSDVGLSDSVTITGFVKQQPDVIDLFAKNPYNVNPITWAVSYDDPGFLGFINTAINYMESTGRIAEFEAKYNAKWLRKKTEWVVE